MHVDLERVAQQPRPDDLPGRCPTAAGNHGIVVSIIEEGNNALAKVGSIG
jgi:hypothetical protein